jgi:hypothetical protein
VGVLLQSPTTLDDAVKMFLICATKVGAATEAALQGCRVLRWMDAIRALKPDTMMPAVMAAAIVRAGAGAGGGGPAANAPKGEGHAVVPTEQRCKDVLELVKEVRGLAARS